MPASEACANRCDDLRVNAREEEPRTKAIEAGRDGVGQHEGASSLKIEPASADLVKLAFVEELKPTTNRKTRRHSLMLSTGV